MNESRMRFDQLNRWLTLGANLGVLAGILLLVFELVQSRELMRAQTRNEISAGIVELQMAVATNPQLSELLHRAASGEELSPEETTQFEHRANAMFRYYENVHYQHRQGLYDDPEFAAQRDAWQSFLRVTVYRHYWCSNRHLYSEKFKALFDYLVDGYC